uniref:Putative secreted protein n=1 Tax=Ixodes ricinus TaxID=34613 RepID=A0A6B0UNH5_IXORI
MSSALQFLLVSALVFVSATVAACGTCAAFELKRWSAGGAGFRRRMLVRWRGWRLCRFRRLLSLVLSGAVLFGDLWLCRISIGVRPSSFLCFPQVSSLFAGFTRGGAPSVGGAAQGRGAVG